jgi:hypothetical protein
MHTPARTTAAALAIIIGLLVLPAAASAGGWATVRLSSTPDNLKPGATWNVEVEVLQHGRTPLDGIHPAITITSRDVSRTFTTTPTGKPGVYRAGVEFPQAGTWRYVVDDGFTAKHSYPPVQIGSPGATSAAGGGGEIAYDRLGLAALAAIAAAACGWLVARRRRRPAAIGG